MMSYFPPLMRKEWAEHHFKLDVAQQLTPFESCHKFLCEKIKIAKHMADTQHFLKSQKQNVTKSHKPVAKSAFTTNVKQQSVLKFVFMSPGVIVPQYVVSLPLCQYRSGVTSLKKQVCVFVAPVIIVFLSVKNRHRVHPVALPHYIL